MQKKILSAVVIVAALVAAGWNYQQSQNNVPMSDLALANIEALAHGEEITTPGGGDITTPTDCPGGLVLCAWIKDPISGSVTYYEK